MAMRGVVSLAGCGTTRKTPHVCNQNHSLTVGRYEDALGESHSIQYLNLIRFTNCINSDPPRTVRSRMGIMILTWRVRPSALRRAYVRHWIGTAGKNVYMIGSTMLEAAWHPAREI